MPDITCPLRPLLRDSGVPHKSLRPDAHIICPKWRILACASQVPKPFIAQLALQSDVRGDSNRQSACEIRLLTAQPRPPLMKTRIAISEYRRRWLRLRSRSHGRDRQLAQAVLSDAIPAVPAFARLKLDSRHPRRLGHSHSPEVVGRTD